MFLQLLKMLIRYLKNLFGENLNIVVPDCDGTAVNSSSKCYKVLRDKFEEAHPMVYVFTSCQLIAVFPFDVTIRWNTKDPRDFTGIIGKLVDKCEEISIITFQTIEVPDHKLPPVIHPNIYQTN